MSYTSQARGRGKPRDMDYSRAQPRPICSRGGRGTQPSATPAAPYTALEANATGASHMDEPEALTQQRGDPYAEAARQLQKLSDSELSMRESFTRRVSHLEGAVKSASKELADLRAREERLARTLRQFSFLHAER